MALNRSRSKPRRTRSWASITRAARGGGGRDAVATARAAMEAGVTLIAPETVFLSPTRSSARCHDRAECRVRSRCRGGGQCRHPRVLHLEGAHVGKGASSARSRGCVQVRSSGEIAYRQFRRGESGRARRRREGQPPRLHRRRRSGRRTSAPARSSATTTA